MKLPLFRHEVTPVWLDHILRDAGLLTHGSITHIDMRLIGEDVGFMGEILELRPVTAPPVALSRSRMILKLPAAGDNHRVGQIAGVYEREIRFYRELGDSLQVRIPACYYADMEVETDPAKGLAAVRFVNRLPLWMLWPVFRMANWLGGRQRRGYALLLEDLGHLRRIDQVAGCSLEDARTALRSMARLHAQFWEGAGLESLHWVVPLELMLKLTQAMYLKTLPLFLADCRDRLTDRDIELLESLKDSGLPLMQSMSRGSRTLLHGDYRLDNLLYDDERAEVVLLDWQTLIQGPAGLELAYFLSASLDEKASDDELQELVSYYHGCLVHLGIEIPLSQLQQEYEAGLMIVLLRVIPAEYQDMLELGDARGHEIAVTWIERVLDKLRRVDTGRVLADSAHVV